MTEKRQTSQGYIIRILQHFATKLWNITNFVMLFQAVMGKGLLGHTKVQSGPPCSTTSVFRTANPARGYILAEFCHSLTDFRANLSSLFKASLF